MPKRTRHSNKNTVQAKKQKKLTAIDYYNLGCDKFEKQQYELAIQDFNESIKLNNNANAYHYRGYAYDKLGKYDEAITDYNEALRINPKLAETYHNRGTIYFNLEQYDKAIEDLTKAFKYNSGFYLSLTVLGDAKAAKGDHEGALDDYKKAINLNPELDIAYNNRGLLYVKQGKDVKAMADYNKAINLNPKLDIAFINRALLYDKQGKIDDALADYKRAIRANPMNSTAYNNLALIYENRGQKDEALDQYANAIKANPEDDIAYFNQADYKFKLKEHKPALEDYEKAIKLLHQHMLKQSGRTWLEERHNRLQFYIGELSSLNDAPDARIAINILEGVRVILAEKLNINNAQKENFEYSNAQNQDNFNAFQFTTGKNLVYSQSSQGHISLGINQLTTANTSVSSQQASLGEMGLLIEDLFQTDYPILSQEPSTSPLTIGVNTQDILGLVLNGDNLVEYQLAQDSAMLQGNQMLNQLPPNDEYSQLSTLNNTPLAQENTTSASQEKSIPPQRDKHKNPSNTTTNLRKFKEKVKPGSISETEEGFEYHIGTTKSKNKMFMDKTKSDQKTPKQSTYDKDAKIAIGRWGEEHVYERLLMPGCKYLAEKYPNYELVDEYIMPIKKQVLIKDKNDQGEIKFCHEEVIVQQQVRTFVDRADSGRTLDIIWNNQLEESRMSYDFKFIEYQDDKILRKHTIEVKATTDDKSRQFKIPPNEALKIFKSHGKDDRRYSIFRVYNVNCNSDKKKPHVIVIENPSQKILDRTLGTNMTLKL